VSKGIIHSAWPRQQHTANTDERTNKKFCEAWPSRMAIRKWRPAIRAIAVGGWMKILCTATIIVSFSLAGHSREFLHRNHHSPCVKCQNIHRTIFCLNAMHCIELNDGKISQRPRPSVSLCSLASLPILWKDLAAEIKNRERARNANRLACSEDSEVPSTDQAEPPKAASDT
jgi:hypothetical protein